MKIQIKNTTKTFALEHDARQAFQLKLGLAPMLLGIAMLGTAPSVLAVDECGPGPTVTCAAATYASGITYNFSSDLSLATGGVVGIGGAGAGLRLTGSGDADLNLTVINRIWGIGGVQLHLDRGNVEADFYHHVSDTSSSLTVNIGTGVNVSTDGSANLRFHGVYVGSIPGRTSNLVMDVGGDSSAWIDTRRVMLSLNLSSRAGGTLTLHNDGGILGSESNSNVSTAVTIRGGGAGHVVLNNALQRGRINARMDFTGLTGQLTILNDFSSSTRKGGWHTRDVNLFGSGDVDIHNGLYGVLRTTTDTVFDFSDTRKAEFFNEGRVMVGATDIGTHEIASQHLRFIGLDRFENAGLILLGTDFDVDEHRGDISNGKVRERLTFEDSHYVGVNGGRIAFDVLLGRATQSDCSTLVVADCVQFIGGSSTEGTTLLNIRDMNPLRSAAGFNPGIVLIEGASAAEHFVLDPASQFYVGHTSSGSALQKGMIAYRLEYDAGTRQHALVGTLADEGVQAATLGAAAHEVWRTSADTWFDRQASLRNGDGEGFVPQGLWAALNTSRGDRSLDRTVDVAGTPSRFNLNQDQDITHFAFGLDVLRGSSGSQSWGGGLTAGLLNSSVDYEATRTQTTMTGMSGGLYGDWSLGALTVDALFNVNYLRQSLKGSSFGLGQHNRLRTQVKSNGGRVEAGWMLSMGENWWLQPLVSVSSVRTSEGDITLPDDAGGVRFGNDDRSLRVGGGLRLGADGKLAGLRTQYRLTGRMWNEREADNTILVDTTEPQPIAVHDDFGGNFNEVDGSVSLSNDAGSFSGYVGVKTRFSNDYSSVGGSAGMRYSW